jgi:hypothetical protein
MDLAIRAGIYAEPDVISARWSLRVNRTMRVHDVLLRRTEERSSKSYCVRLEPDHVHTLADSIRMRRYANH